MVTFRKSSSGDWVVYGPAAEVTVGKVRVTKKDGRVNSVHVESLGRPFRASSQEMVYGYIASKAPKSAPVEAPPPAHEESLEEALGF